MTIRISLSTVLVALVFAAIGAGTAVGVMLWEPWDDGDQPIAVEQQLTPTETGPTRAELDAERQREEDTLCLEAKQTAASQEAAHVARQAAIERGEIRASRLSDFSLFSSGVDKSVLDAIDRYCK